MFIYWEKITIKNFMSYGNEPTTFFFNKSPTTLIVGKNGAGKSSIIEAFVFAIKGNTYRGSNKNELINTVNQKDCVVELHFQKNNSQYIITRGMKPNIFFITKDGKKIEESASIRDMQYYLETQVLQTSVTGIIKTSILGCDFKPFMMMTAKEKRDLIETLLEINVFTEMNKILKTKIAAFKEEYIDHQNQLKIKEGVLEAKKTLYEKLRDNNNKNSEKEKEELVLLKRRIQDVEDQINSKNTLLQTLSFPHDINDVNSKLSALNKKINEYQYDINQKVSLVQKFDNMNGECGECGQEVTAEHKQTHINNANTSINESKSKIAELENEKVALQQIVNDYNAHQKSYQSLLTEINNLIINLDHIKESTLKKVKAYKEMVKNEGIGIEQHKEDYENTKKELKELKEKEKEFIKMRNIYNLSTQLLKDEGIKSIIVNQYIPVLNQSVNYYLQCLNSPIRFNIDKNLEVRLDSRYPGEFSYHTLSMGERQRIDLSMSFAWRKVASVKNSVNTNLLILDETFDASVDGDGTDDLLSILEDIQSSNVNIFVISHKGGLEDKLRSTIRIEKKQGFSKIIKETTTA